MSVQHFIVEVEATSSNVEYIRHLLNGALRQGNAQELFPLTKVRYLGEFETSKWAEEIERDADERGELPL